MCGLPPAETASDATKLKSLTVALAQVIGSKALGERIGDRHYGNGKLLEPNVRSAYPECSL